MLPLSAFADALQVRSEVYAVWLEDEIQTRLDALEKEITGGKDDGNAETA